MEKNSKKIEASKKVKIGEIVDEIDFWSTPILGILITLFMLLTMPIIYEAVVEKEVEMIRTDTK